MHEEGGTLTNSYGLASARRGGVQEFEFLSMPQLLAACIKYHLMTHIEARASKLQKGLAIAQASMLMLAVISFAVPSQALAIQVSNKVNICHKPDGPNPQILNVAASAVAAHLAHGDSLDVEHCGESVPTEPQTCEFVSDATTMVGESPAVLLDAPYIHPVWTTALNASGANWIWNDTHAHPGASDEVVTFTKQFNVVGTPTNVDLTLASDNNYTVLVNGSPASCDGSGLNNFNSDTGTYGASGGPDSCDITSLVNTGVNTLTFTVTNPGGYGDDPAGNPGGLIYSVAIVGAACAAVPPPPPTTGTLVVYKSVVGAPEGVDPEDFQISVMTTGEVPGNVSNSPHAGSASGVSYSLAPGAYTVHEDAYPNYVTTYSENCANGNVNISANEQKSCTVTNTYVAPPITVTASKIVCENEADLPNAGQHNGPFTSIDASTAANWVANHPSCHLVPNWSFEWANQNGGDMGDSNTGSGAGGYTTFGTTDGTGSVTTQIPSAGLSEIHLREVLQPGFIPFTFNAAGGSPNDNNNVSAEFYCSDDVLHYDNFDFIRNAQSGNHYYCVAFNAPKKTDVTLCKYDDHEHPLAGWNLTLAGESVENLSVNSNTSAGINSTPLLSGVSYLVKASGTWNNQGGANPVDAEYSTTDGWTTHMDGYTGYGVGILETEIAQTDGNWGPYNGAHQYAQSFVQGANAPVNFRIFDGDTGTHVQNEGWFGDNSGSIALNLFKGYSGITGENGCVTLHDVPYGTYTVGETPKDGWVNVSGTGEVTVDAESHVFNVVNHQKMCTIVSNTSTFEDGDPAFLSTFIHGAWTAAIAGASWIWGEDPTANTVTGSTETFVKTFSLTEIPSSASLEIAADNSYTVTVNGTPVASDAGEFNYSAAGQDTISIPTNLLVVGDNEVDIAVTNMPQAGGTSTSNPAGLLYKLTLTGADCQETTPEDDGGGDEGGGDNDHDGSLTIVKHTTSGDGSFSFSVTGNEESTSTVITTVEGSGSHDFDLADGEYNVLELVPEGWNLDDVSCEYDNESVGIAVENGEHISLDGDDHVTCTFTNSPEEQPVVPHDSHGPVQTESGSNNGDVGGNGGGSSNDGEVAGASTEACVPLLTNYLKMGWKNDSEVVKKLQKFLADNLGINLPVTGFFGPLTFNAVKAFQKGDWEDVLKPWISVPGSGITGQDTPTGFVYKTTKWHINNLVCPGSEEFPTDLN